MTSAVTEEWLTTAEALATDGRTGSTGPAALILDGLIGEARHYLTDEHYAQLATLSPRAAFAFAADVLAQAQEAEEYADRLAARC